MTKESLKEWYQSIYGNVPDMLDEQLKIIYDKYEIDEVDVTEHELVSNSKDYARNDDSNWSLKGPIFGMKARLRSRRFVDLGTYWFTIRRADQTAPITFHFLNRYKDYQDNWIYIPAKHPHINGVYGIPCLGQHQDGMNTSANGGHLLSLVAQAKNFLNSYYARSTYTRIVEYNRQRPIWRLTDDEHQKELAEVIETGNTEDNPRHFTKYREGEEYEGWKILAVRTLSSFHNCYRHRDYGQYAFSEEHQASKLMKIDRLVSYIMTLKGWSIMTAYHFVYKLIDTYKEQLLGISGEDHDDLRAKRNQVANWTADRGRRFRFHNTNINVRLGQEYTDEMTGLLRDIDNLRNTGGTSDVVNRWPEECEKILGNLDKIIKKGLDFKYLTDTSVEQMNGKAIMSKFKLIDKESRVEALEKYILALTKEKQRRFNELNEVENPTKSIQKDKLPQATLFES